MPSCARCKKCIANKRLQCNTCGIALHLTCAERYLRSSKSKECCLKAIPLSSAGEIPESAGTSSLVSQSSVSSRTTTFDAQRCIDPNLGLSDRSASISTSSPIKPQAKEDSVITDNIEMVYFTKYHSSAQL